MDILTDQDWIDEWGQAQIWPGLQIGYRIGL